MIANTIISKMSQIKSLVGIFENIGGRSLSRLETVGRDNKLFKGIFEVLAYIYLAAMLYTNPTSLFTFGSLLLPLYFLGALDSTTKRAATLSTLAAISFLFPGFGAIDLSSIKFPAADLIEGIGRLPAEIWGSVIMSLGLGFLISTIDSIKQNKETTTKTTPPGAQDAITGFFSKTKTMMSPTTRMLRYYTIFTTIMSGVSFGAFMINSGMGQATPNIVASSALSPWTDWDPVTSPYDDPPQDPGDTEETGGE